MDKLINNRKKQLLDMQQMLRMQDLLQQYDRQNLFLNRQVDSLLKQNLMLKQQKSLNYSGSSHILQTEDYFSRDRKNSSFAANQQAKSFSYQKGRKSRYESMYDDSEIKGLKTTLKNQIKRDTNRHISTKEIENNIEDFSIHVPPKIHEPKFQVNKPREIQKSSGQKTKFTPVKKQSQSSMTQSQQVSPSKSKSKSKSRQKLEVSLRSRVYDEPKPIPSTQDKNQSPKRSQHRIQQPIQPKQQFTLKQIQQGAQLILEHSFGNKSAQRIQKKFTILESDLNLGDSSSKQEKQKEKEITESRMSHKFIPLSIQSNYPSKELSINPSKSSFQHPGPSIQSESGPRTESKQKRNHSLNPSPKVEFNLTSSVSHTIKPFVLKTEEIIPASFGPSVELHRNPSEKIKRKFIKIVSSQKIPAPQSPKK